ncbi:MAG: segregation and condensation protein A [Actinomycetota bacterium]
MPYEVKLEVFEGPIDLLLHLITRQRVDIYDVSLATITEEYLAAYKTMDHLDLESATGFLVVAAALLELKSARLLPAHGSDEAGHLLEERDLLLARLVECATYREAGSWISGRLASGARYHARQAGLEEPYAAIGPDVLAGVGPLELAAAGARLLATAPAVVLDISHLAPIRASVRDAIVDVADLLHERPATLDELCGPGPRRIEVVVRFLALLELYKAGAIELIQADRWGAIRASWTGDVAPEEVVDAAEEYQLTPDGAGEGEGAR